MPLVFSTLHFYEVKVLYVFAKIDFPSGLELDSCCFFWKASTSQKPCKVLQNEKMTSLKCCKVCKNANWPVTTMGSQRFGASQKSKNTREFAKFILRLSPLSTHMDFDAQKRNTYATCFLCLRSRSTHMDFNSQKCNTYATFERSFSQKCNTYATFGRSEAGRWAGRLVDNIKNHNIIIL